MYILTSPFSVSATEIMILSTLSFSNFKKVGANTNGAFSNLLEKNFQMDGLILYQMKSTKALMEKFMNQQGFHLTMK